MMGVITVEIKCTDIIMATYERMITATTMYIDEKCFDSRRIQALNV